MIARDLTHNFTPLQALIITAPTLLLGAYYLRRSAQVSRFMLLSFLVSVAYGIGVELLDIRTTETYFYTDLLLMVGRDPNWVPFSVGVSWACILFIVMLTSDRLALPVLLRPAFDGALALSLDFVMDPVASASVWVPRLGATCSTVTSAPFGGIGMWTWCVPEGASALWYNVPIANFIGWFLVVACVSAALRIVRGPLRGPERGWPLQLVLIIASAVVAGLTVLGSAWAYPYIFPTATVQFVVLAILFVAPIVAVVLLRSRLRFDNPLDKGLLLLPALILVSELVSFFRHDIDRAHWPTAASLIIAMAVLSAALLVLPYAQALGDRRGRIRGEAKQQLG